MKSTTGRILAIDYGRARIGLAATDPLQIIVNGLDTIANVDFRDWLQNYLKAETVIKIVFGKPVHKDGNVTLLWEDIQKEDVDIIQGMQTGRNSPSYNGGNFSPVMDNPTHHFHKWVAQNLI